MKPNTKKVITSMRKTYLAAGLELSELSEDNANKIMAITGWSESTLKTFLAYSGLPNSKLVASQRNYIPTDAEVTAVVHHFGEFGMLLAFTGLRFSELWQVTMDGNTLNCKTRKGSDPVSIKLEGKILKAALRWVAGYRPSPSQVRRKWERLQREGILSNKCVPHSFRHRVITKLVLDGGVSMEEAGKIVGHKSSKTTARYFHVGGERAGKSLSMAGLLNV